MTLGQRIQHYRTDQALSQEALGNSLGVSRQAVSRWEADAAVPDVDKLIALSKLFTVPVGVLLGVEEDSPGREELTDRELRALEAIAAKLTPPPGPAAPPPKKRRRILLAAAVLAALFVGVQVFQRMDALENQMRNLQTDVTMVDRSVSIQVNSIANRVEDLLERQNSVTTDQGYEIASADLAANTVTFRLWATPRVYREGMTARFTAETGAGDPVSAPAEAGEGQRYSATLTCPLTDDIALSVSFLSGEERRNQLLGQEDDLYQNSLPQPYCTSGPFLWISEYPPGGSLTLRPRDLLLSWEKGWLETASDRLETTLTSATFRLWQDGKLISTAPADLGEAEQQHWQTPWPDQTFSLAAPAEGTRLTLSLLATDNYGRTFECALTDDFIQSSSDSSYHGEGLHSEPYPWET